MFKPCPGCGMFWHFSCGDENCLCSVCTYCELDDKGVPLQASPYDRLEPLGIHRKDDLVKSET